MSVVLKIRVYLLLFVKLRAVKIKTNIKLPFFIPFDIQRKNICEK